MGAILGMLFPAVARFWGKDLIMALAFGVGSVALVIGGAVAYHNIKATLVAARDGEWQSKIAEANKAHERARERQNEAADKAAAFERDQLKLQLEAEIELRADLEKTLARLRTAPGGDPVAFPKDLARELRR